MVSTDPERMAQQIAEQQRLSEAVKAHRPNLDELLDTGRDLLKHSSGEDLDNLQGQPCFHAATSNFVKIKILSL